nr:DGQHR domain-containing protein [Exiguobacterium sp. s133]
MRTGKLPVSATHALLRRIPRDYDNPEGIQRALKDSKVSNIEKIVKEDESKYSSPNAVVLSLVTSHEYVSLETDHTNKEISYFIIDLEGFENVVTEAEVDADGYLCDENIFPGTMIDGHHRTAGFYRATKHDMELPVTVYVDLPSKDMAKVFADINIYQEKPSTVHSLAMKALSGTLSSDEEISHNIVTMLNQEDWSILYRRIKDIDGPRPKDYPKSYVTNSTLVKLVEDHVLNAVPVGLAAHRIAELLNDYFEAVSKVYPIAWSDEKSHVLVKSMGFQIMLRIFDKVFTMVYKESIPSKQDFENFFESYMNPANELIVHDKALDLDWNSKDYGGYSSGKGINDITAAVQRHIVSIHHEMTEQSSR